MAFVTLQDFRDRCALGDAEGIVEDVLLADDAIHVTASNRAHLIQGLAAAYGVPDTSVRLWIVGSAKLGFATNEKKKDGNLYPRYRLFSAVSDIDVAVVSPEIFTRIWDELSVHAHGHPWMPWDSKKLGDYLVYGWLRPDHFPGGANMRRCNDWWDSFRNFSADPRFGRHSVRGGLFHSVDDLRRYQRRSVLECIRVEQGTL